jgi:hypothetical protein
MKHNYNKRKENWLGLTWTGISLPQAYSKNRTNSWVVVDTGSMTRRHCSLFESLLAWWWLGCTVGCRFPTASWQCPGGLALSSQHVHRDYIDDYHC